MVVLMKRVDVERELGSGQGAMSPEFHIVIILGHLALVQMLPWSSCISSDVVLTPQAYPEL